ncbi:hypothetical protein C5167_010636 [Papaver somniferum]|uniref:Uncharacterized protein n=1 Tax=Papaver somniferum TaxID=3469 RepID=A0A4Y7K0T9_PAPSO|nr:hypothetical protein C5167_010636 [Papaver somniferum]
MAKNNRGGSPDLRPSAPRAKVTRSSSDCGGGGGIPTKRSNHPLGPVSSGTNRKFDDIDSLLSLHIDRGRNNFDEDERGNNQMLGAIKVIKVFQMLRVLEKKLMGYLEVDEAAATKLHGNAFFKEEETAAKERKGNQGGSKADAEECWRRGDWRNSEKQQQQEPKA